MAFWIRVDANVSRNAKVRRFRTRLADGPADSPRDIFGNVQRVSVAEAVGLLVALWGTLAQQQPDGMVSTISDADLEDWAGWRGTPGWFATAFREFFQDKAGQVHDWDEFAGVLVTRREADKARKQAARDAAKDGKSAGTSVGHPADRPPDVRQASSRNGNGNGNDTENSTTTTARGRASVSDDDLAPYPALQAWRRGHDLPRGTADRHIPLAARARLLDDLATVAGEHGTPRALARCNEGLQGGLRVQLRAADLVEALDQYLATARPRFHLQQFVRWLEGVRDELPARPRGGPGARDGAQVNAAASDAGGAAYDALTRGHL